MGCGSGCSCSSGSTTVLDGPLPDPFAEPCCGSCAMGWPCEGGCGGKASGADLWSIPVPAPNPGFQFLPGDSWSAEDPDALGAGGALAPIAPATMPESGFQFMDDSWSVPDSSALTVSSQAPSPGLATSHQAAAGFPPADPQFFPSQETDSRASLRTTEPTTTEPGTPGLFGSCICPIKEEIKWEGWSGCLSNISVDLSMWGSERKPRAGRCHFPPDCTQPPENCRGSIKPPLRLVFTCPGYDTSCTYTSPTGVTSVCTFQWPYYYINVHNGETLRCEEKRVHKWVWTITPWFWSPPVYTATLTKTIECEDCPAAAACTGGGGGCGP